ncbi:hypothetical protein Pfo_010053 [Paulownia fortunei]|nr:hypothetical protein Pfo_010053 [Paulownia fortunei]
MGRWSQIAAKLPGRTDNEIKNFWNTKLRKKLLQKGSTEYSSQPQIPTTDDNFLANYLIMSTVYILLGFLNMAQSDVAQKLLLQEWERKQQEMVMVPIPNNPFLPDSSTLSQSDDGLGNELLNAGNGTIPFEYYTNLTSDAWFEGGYNPESGNFFNIGMCSNNDLTEYYMLPALVSATDDEIPMPRSDEFYANPNSVTSFEYEWIENEVNYQSPDLGSTMQKKEILASCTGLSPSFMDNATSLKIYDGASCSFNDDFHN